MSLKPVSHQPYDSRTGTFFINRRNSCGLRKTAIQIRNAADVASRFFNMLIFFAISLRPLEFARQLYGCHTATGCQSYDFILAFVLRRLHGDRTNILRLTRKCLASGESLFKDCCGTYQQLTDSHGCPANALRKVIVIPSLLKSVPVLLVISRCRNFRKRR